MSVRLLKVTKISFRKYRSNLDLQGKVTITKAINAQIFDGLQLCQLLRRP